LGSRWEGSPIADYSDLTFTIGDLDYPSQCQTLTSRTEAIATEVEDARIGAATLAVRTQALQTELEDSREGEVDLETNLQNNYLKNDGNQATSFSANSQKITNSVAGTLPSDGVTVTQSTDIEALGAGGIDQSVIAITSLNVDNLTANEVVGANSGASALEAKDLTNISSGTLTTGYRVQTKGTGDGLEDYDSDLEESSSTLFGITM